MKPGMIFGQADTRLHNDFRFKYLGGTSYEFLVDTYGHKAGTTQNWLTPDYAYPIDETMGKPLCDA